MDRIRIVIAHLKSAPVARGLRLLLARTKSFEVTELERDSDIAEAVASIAPRILIVEGGDASACVKYLRLNDALSVIALDSSEAQAFIGLNNPAWERLASFIRVIVSEPPEHADVTGRVHVLMRNSLAAEASDEGRPQNGPAPPCDDYRGLKQWLDAVFAHRIACGLSDDRDGTSGVRVWSMSAQQALDMLGLDASKRSPADLERDLERIDRAFVEAHKGLPPALARIAEAFRLDPTELRLLCLVLAPELDARYGAVIGYLQDDLTRRRPSLSLLAGLTGEADLAWPLRRRLAGRRPFAVHRLIQPSGANSSELVDPGYVVAPVLLDVLVSGLEGAAERAGMVPEPANGTTSAQSGDRQSCPETEQLLALADAIASGSNPPPIVLLGGRNGAVDWFAGLLRDTHANTLTGDIGDASDGAVEQRLDAWAALAALYGAALIVTGLDRLEPPQRRLLSRHLARLAPEIPLLVLHGERIEIGRLQTSLPLWPVDPPQPRLEDRMRQWKQAADAAGLPVPAELLGQLSACVQFGRAEIDTCIALAHGESLNEADLDASDCLMRAARRLTRHIAPPAVRRIDAVFQWDDIVLPAPIKQQLHLIPSHIRLAGRVLDEWGYGERLPYGRGVAALFSGASGTGKTMAAQIIALELGTDLFQIDLSKTVSKYIGETEKNLDAIFDAAEQANAVLLFDEADALFGKRTEVKDAHDRHANVEVAYLLQRMEAFSGLAVLTTNLKQNIDQAFLRRLRFVVDFPLPDAADREKIWRGAFPSDAPLASDVDVAFLARRLMLTGGNIQQIAVHAAYAAAAEDDVIAMRHVVHATRQELIKVGMLNAEKHLDGLAA